MNKIRKMKKLDEILEELLKSKYNYMDERVKLSKLAQTCTAIISLMKSIVPEEKELIKEYPNWDDPDYYKNKGHNSCVKEINRRIDEKDI